MMRRRLYELLTTLGAIAATITAMPLRSVADDPLPPRVECLDADPGAKRIMVGDMAIATFVYADPAIPRPYLKDVRTAKGVAVSRRYPPEPARDLVDHPAFHPGLWLAFGDVGGLDTWRNKAQVTLVPDSLRFRGEREWGMLGAQFTYHAQGAAADKNSAETTVCTEDFRATFIAAPNGWLLMWDSKFTADPPVSFGDQEEMGLGIRVATEMRAEPAKGSVSAGNGRLLDAEGRKNGGEIWGKSAAWCDFSGRVDEQPAGVALFCHPDNVRPSWFHARDYGLLVANLFGRRAFHAGEASSIPASDAKPLRLRYGIFVHDDLQDPTAELNEAYKKYLDAEQFTGPKDPAPAP